MNFSRDLCKRMAVGSAFVCGFVLYFFFLEIFENVLAKNSWFVVTSDHFAYISCLLLLHKLMVQFLKGIR